MSKIINDLIYGGVLKTDSIIEAFSNISRNEFLPSKLRRAFNISSNVCVPTGHGFVTPSISTIARIFESLQSKEGDNVLVIGEIDGWITTLLSYLVGPNGSVLVITRVEKLEKFLRDKVRDFDFMNNNNYSIHAVNYSKMESCCNVLEDRKFDKILVLEKFLIKNCDVNKLLKNKGFYTLSLITWKIKMK